MLNENIKKYRLENNMTQDELADRLHIVRQTVSKWENNRAVPDAQMLVRISEVLGIPVLKLLGESEKNVKTGDSGEIQEDIQKEAERYENRDNKIAGQKDTLEDIQEKSERYLIYTKKGTWEDAQPKIDELSRHLEVMSEKMAEEMLIRKRKMGIIAVAVSVVVICVIAVGLTYYNPTIRYSIMKPLDGDTQYYYEDIHISYKTKFGLPLPLKYKELISDFTEKSAMVMKDIRDNYEAPMHIEITVINDKDSMRVLYSGTVTKNGVEQKYINSFWIAGNIRESD